MARVVPWQGAQRRTPTIDRSLPGLLAAEYPQLAIWNACSNGARVAETLSHLRSLQHPVVRFDVALVLAGGNDVIRMTKPEELFQQANGLLQTPPALANQMPAQSRKPASARPSSPRRLPVSRIGFWNTHPSRCWQSELRDDGNTTCPLVARLVHGRTSASPVGGLALGHPPERPLYFERKCSETRRRKAPSG